MPAFFNPGAPHFCAGVDVSLDSLELCLLDAGAAVLSRQVCANSKSGIRELIALLKRQGRIVRVCIEPTSRYHEALALALSSKALCILHLPNPRSVHDCASALSRRAKTDRCAAELLARMAHCLALPAWTPPAQAASNLSAVATRLNQITSMRSQEKNRLKLLLRCPSAPALRSAVQSHIAQLKRRGEALEQEALSIIAGDTLLSRRDEQLLSIPGIGQTSAIQLLAFLNMLPPELNKRQWVACAGLDPAPRESGQSTKPRRISRRGSPRLRRALFMPALVAMRHNPPLRACYERLCSRGKKPLVALSALMAKLLHIIWAMWKHDQLFDPTKPVPHTA
jgi:transposase